MAPVSISTTMRYVALWLALYGVAAAVMWLLDLILRCAVVWAAMLLYQEMASRAIRTPARHPTRSKPSTAQESRVDSIPPCPGHYDVRGRECATTFSQNTAPPKYTAKDTHVRDSEPYIDTFIGELVGRKW